MVSQCNWVPGYGNFRQICLTWLTASFFHKNSLQFLFVVSFGYLLLWLLRESQRKKSSNDTWCNMNKTKTFSFALFGCISKSKNVTTKFYIPAKLWTKYITVTFCILNCLTPSVIKGEIIGSDSWVRYHCTKHGRPLPQLEIQLSVEADSTFQYFLLLYLTS